MPDILIRFDEFPASCDVCPFVGINDDLMSDDYRHLYCGFPYRGEFVTDYEKSRHPDCPLHELPEHGDLISKDDMMKAILGEPPETHYPSWYALIVDKMPVIVPADKEDKP